ncbi:hypothetical protein FHS95_004093 [Sphingomonas naasensis]|uniref:DUF6265 domain-containing protein n=1 Tax=Sphingomonas naasensis TaxID=1344951 RepID=A0A4S1WGF7_9SPHN|nr:DUF6265 family protein [Sphingomonas naasensis]NIJ22378.1 hypothetical protein [Sphingomonas naasensis]TGX40630.1 hypothetical protein E5A74_14060 [Sphingomonas naasensis]
MLLFLAPLLFDAQTPDLGWLVGHWCTEPKNGGVTCENWAPMQGGAMRGTGTSEKAGKVTANEAMTILISDSGVVFHAEPANQPPADFRAVKLDAAARSVTFEDATHDYPQRVRYWREGEALLAEISLADGSQARRWRFQRVK